MMFANVQDPEVLASASYRRGAYTRVCSLDEQIAYLRSMLDENPAKYKALVESAPESERDAVRQQCRAQYEMLCSTYDVLHAVAAWSPWMRAFTEVFAASPVAPPPTDSASPPTQEAPDE